MPEQASASCAELLRQELVMASSRRRPKPCAQRRVSAWISFCLAALLDKKNESLLLSSTVGVGGLSLVKKFRRAAAAAAAADRPRYEISSQQIKKEIAGKTRFRYYAPGCGGEQSVSAYYERLQQELTLSDSIDHDAPASSIKRFFLFTDASVRSVPDPVRGGRKETHAQLGIVGYSSQKSSAIQPAAAKEEEDTGLDSEGRGKDLSIYANAPVLLAAGLRRPEIGPGHQISYTTQAQTVMDSDPDFQKMPETWRTNALVAVAESEALLEGLELYKRGHQWKVLGMFRGEKEKGEAMASAAATTSLPIRLLAFTDSLQAVRVLESLFSGGGDEKQDGPAGEVAGLCPSGSGVVEPNWGERQASFVRRAIVLPTAELFRRIGLADAFLTAFGGLLLSQHGGAPQEKSTPLVQQLEILHVRSSSRLMRGSDHGADELRSSGSEHSRRESTTADTLPSSRTFGNVLADQLASGFTLKNTGKSGSVDLLSRRFCGSPAGWLKKRAGIRKIASAGADHTGSTLYTSCKELFEDLKQKMRGGSGHPILGPLVKEFTRFVSKYNERMAPRLPRKANSRSSSRGSRRSSRSGRSNRKSPSGKSRSGSRSNSRSGKSRSGSRSRQPQQKDDVEMSAPQADLEDGRHDDVFITEFEPLDWFHTTAQVPMKYCGHPSVAFSTTNELSEYVALIKEQSAADVPLANAFNFLSYQSKCLEAFVQHRTTFSKPGAKLLGRIWSRIKVLREVRKFLVRAETSLRAFVQSIATDSRGPQGGPAPNTYRSLAAQVVETAEKVAKQLVPGQRADVLDGYIRTFTDTVYAGNAGIRLGTRGNYAAFATEVVKGLSKTVIPRVTEMIRDFSEKLEQVAEEEMLTHQTGGEKDRLQMKIWEMWCNFVSEIIFDLPFTAAAKDEVSQVVTLPLHKNLFEQQLLEMQLVAATVEKEREAFLDIDDNIHREADRARYIEKLKGARDAYLEAATQLGDLAWAYESGNIATLHNFSPMTLVQLVAGVSPPSFRELLENGVAGRDDVLYKNRFGIGRLEMDEKLEPVDKGQCLVSIHGRRAPAPEKFKPRRRCLSDLMNLDTNDRAKAELNPRSREGLALDPRDDREGRIPDLKAMSNNNWTRGQSRLQGQRESASVEAVMRDALGMDIPVKVQKVKVDSSSGKPELEIVLDLPLPDTARQELASLNSKQMQTWEESRARSLIDNLFKTKIRYTRGMSWTTTEWERAKEEYTKRVLCTLDGGKPQRGSSNAIQRMRLQRGQKWKWDGGEEWKQKGGKAGVITFEKPMGSLIEYHEDLYLPYAYTRTEHLEGATPQQIKDFPLVQVAVLWYDEARKKFAVLQVGVYSAIDKRIASTDLSRELVIIMEELRRENVRMKNYSDAMRLQLGELRVLEAIVGRHPDRVPSYIDPKHLFGRTIRGILDEASALQP
ncbi:unnamed protein product [Amoebophrya sp. A120]|nr:unnamed protein product [Amoebophrya sp. A120]|eukprot:GSA120T00021336001.1